MLSSRPSCRVKRPSVGGIPSASTPRSDAVPGQGSHPHTAVERGDVVASSDGWRHGPIGEDALFDASRRPGPRSSCRNGRQCADRSHRPCRCHRRYDNPCRRPVAVSVATEFQTSVNVERLGDRYRWSLIHRGGPYPLLRITAMNKWTLKAGCRVWSAAGPWVILRATLSTGRATRGTRGC